MLEGIFQPMHLLMIFGIALLVFGPKKLPELGKGIGEGIRGLRSAMKEHEEPSGRSTNPHRDTETQPTQFVGVEAVRKRRAIYRGN
jgi:sec-independent protein translocase protein TatA